MRQFNIALPNANKCPNPSKNQKIMDLVLFASDLLCAKSDRLGLFSGIGGGAGLGVKVFAGVGGADLGGGAVFAAGVLVGPCWICFAVEAVVRCLARTTSVQLLGFARSLPTTSDNAFIHPSFSAALSA